MSEVVVVAKFRVKENFLDEVYAEVVELYKKTHANDKGCIQYDFHKDLNDKYSFTFVETWASMDALSKHEQKEHFLTCIQNINDKLENITIDKLEKIKI